MNGPLAPAAQYVSDLETALNKAQAAGVPFDKIAAMTADFAADIAELADDSQWPDDPPQTMAEARAQLNTDHGQP